MEMIYTAALAIAAFLLGAIPFSVIIGRWLLKKDITQYGDHNPGATNVFRAGSKKVGLFAVILDILKGIPFVFIAHYVLNLPVLALVIIAVCAVLGHAFSPFLSWKGGKAIGVTFGTMLGLMPQYDVFMVFAIAMILAAFLIRNDSWGVIIATVATLIYFTVVKGYSWEPLLMLCFLVILVIKHIEDLHSVPHLGGRFLKRSHAR
jgi:acyl phosphate:glycerol-3-phosphate acyltransferase